MCFRKAGGYFESFRKRKTPLSSNINRRFFSLYYEKDIHKKRKEDFVDNLRQKKETRQTKYLTKKCIVYGI